MLFWKWFDRDHLRLISCLSGSSCFHLYVTTVSCYPINFQFWNCNTKIETQAQESTMDLTTTFLQAPWGPYHVDHIGPNVPLWPPREGEGTRKHPVHHLWEQSSFSPFSPFNLSKIQASALVKHEILPIHATLLIYEILWIFFGQKNVWFSLTSALHRVVITKYSDRNLIRH